MSSFRNFLTACARLPKLAPAAAATAAAAFSFFALESHADVWLGGTGGTGGTNKGNVVAWDTLTNALTYLDQQLVISGNGSYVSNNQTITNPLFGFATGPVPGNLYLQDGGKFTTTLSSGYGIYFRGGSKLTIGSEDGTEGPGYFSTQGTSVGSVTWLQATDLSHVSTLRFNYAGDSYYLASDGSPTGRPFTIYQNWNVIHDAVGTTYWLSNTPGSVFDYSGTTTINKGKIVMTGTKATAGAGTFIKTGAALQVGNGGINGTWTGNVDIETGGTFTISRSNTYDVNANLVITGLGDVFFDVTKASGSIPFKGNLAAKNLTIDSVGSVTFAADKTVSVTNLYVNSSGSTKLQGNDTHVTAISGNLTKNGTGPLSITTGSPSGAVTVNSGILTLQAPVVDGGTWNPTSIDVGLGAKIQFGTKGSEATNSSFTLGTSIIGDGSLAMLQYSYNDSTRINTLTISVPQYYTGGTTINGRLILTETLTETGTKIGTLGSGDVKFGKSGRMNDTGSSRLYLNYGVGTNITLTNNFDGSSANYGNIIKQGAGTVTLTGDIGLNRTIRSLFVEGGELVLGDGGAPPAWGVRALTAESTHSGVNISSGAALVFNHDGYLYPYVFKGSGLVQAGHPYRTVFHGTGDVINRGDGMTVIMGYNNHEDSLSGNWIVEHGRLQAGMGGQRGTLTYSEATLLIKGPRDIAGNSGDSGNGIDPLRAANPAYADDEKHQLYDGTFSIFTSDDLNSSGNSGSDPSIKVKIRGSGTFLKKGANSVWLTHAESDFSGTYVVESGGLVFKNSRPTTYADFDLQRNAFATSGTKTGGAYNSVLTFDAAANLAGKIYGNGVLRKTHSGTLTLLGDNTYAGGTHINSSGTISVGNGGTTGTIGSGAIVFGTPATLIFNREDTLLVPGNISGSGITNSTNTSTITQTGGTGGTGTTILSGKSSYTSVTNITGGTLVLAGDNTQAHYTGNTYDSNKVTITVSPGATLQIGNGGTGGLIYQPVFSIGASDNLNRQMPRLVWEGTSAKPATLAINHADTVIWKRPLTGTRASGNEYVEFTGYNSSNEYSIFAQIGTGTTRLTQDNSGATTNYLGTIRVDNGKLAISSDSNLGTNSTNILNGGTLLLEAEDTFSRKWTLNATSNGIEVATGKTNTFSDAALLSGAGGFTKLGGGTLTLAGATPNTFTGSVHVREGTLAISNNGKLGANSTHYLEGGTLRFAAGAYGSIWEVSSVSTGANRIDVATDLYVPLGEIRTAAAQIHQSSSGKTFDFYQDGSFEKIGEGILELTNFSNFEGGVKLTAGKLEFAMGNNSIDAYTYTLKGPLSIGAGAELRISGAGEPQTFQITKIASTDSTSKLWLNFGGASGTLNFVTDGKMTLNSSITNNNGGSVLVSGSGTLALNGNVTFDEGPGDFRVQGGTLQMGGNTIAIQGTFGLSAGATLSGGGTIPKNIHSEDFTSAGSVISPGAAPGAVGAFTITTTSAAFDNTTFKMNVGATHDTIDINVSSVGQVSLANSNIELSNTGTSVWGTGGEQTLITVDKGISGTPAATFKGVAFGTFGTNSHIGATVTNSGTAISVTPTMSGTSAPISSSTTDYTWAAGNGGFWNADRLSLTGSGTVTVAVAAPGVITGELSVSGTGTDYTFTGGRIVGGRFADGSSGTTGALILNPGNPGNPGATATFANAGVDFEDIQVGTGAKVTFQNPTNAKVITRQWTLDGGTVEFSGNTSYRLDVPVVPVTGSGTFLGTFLKTVVSPSAESVLTVSAPLGALGASNTYTFNGTFDTGDAGTDYNKFNIVNFEIEGGRTQVLQTSEPVLPTLAGSGNFLKTGDGALVLDGPTTTSGAFDVREGLLGAFDVREGLLSLLNPNGANEAPLDNSAKHILRSGATLEFGSSAEYNSTWQFAGARPLVSVPNGISAILNGQFENIPGLAASPLVKVGKGTLTLAGYNTYQGNTYIEGGNVVLSGRLESRSEPPSGDKYYSDYQKDIVLSPSTTLTLALEPTRAAQSGQVQLNYQRFSGAITGDTAVGQRSLVLNASSAAATVDFNGRVEVPFTAIKGTVGGTGYLADFTMASASKYDLTISPGNNNAVDSAIGSLTIGKQSGGVNNFENLTLLVDVVGSSTSDTLYVTGNATWNPSTINVNVRTNFPDTDTTWENGTYLIARANPGASDTVNTSVAFTPVGGDINQTPIYFNGVPAANTRLQASLEFLKVLTATTEKTATYGETDTSAIVLHTAAGENEVLYWQGHESGSWKPLVPLNWRWFNVDADVPVGRTISFWDGDAVILANNDGVDGGAAIVTNKAINVSAGGGGVYVASMIIDGTGYNLTGEKITGSVTHSKGMAIEEVLNEEYVWLTGALTVKPTGVATISNDLDFSRIEVQGSGGGGGNLTVSGITRSRSGVITVGQSARLTLAGEHGVFQDVEHIVLGQNAVLTFNKPEDSQSPEQPYIFTGAISNQINEVVGDDDSTPKSYFSNGSVVKSNTGKVILTGEHSYSGDTLVTGGTLEFSGYLGVHEYINTEYYSSTYSVVELQGDPMQIFVPNYKKQIILSANSTVILNPEDVQILSNATPITGPADTGIGYARKEGTGTLVIPGTSTISKSVQFTHAKGTLAGTGTIQNIAFESGAIISPGDRPYRYSIDGETAYIDGGISSGNIFVPGYGQIKFGDTGTTHFNGIVYELDLDLESALTVGPSDRIVVTGNVEFGKSAANTIDLGPVTSLGDSKYTILTATGTLETGNLAETIILYANGSTSTATRERAFVRIDPDHFNELQLLTYNNANLRLTWTGLDQKSPPGTPDNVWNLDVEKLNWREDEHHQHFKTNDIVTFPVTLPTGAYGNSEKPPKNVHLGTNIVVGEMNVEGTGYTFIGSYTITGTTNGDDATHTTRNIEATNSLNITSSGSAVFENTSVNFATINIAGEGSFNYTQNGFGKIKITSEGAGSGIYVSGTGKLKLGMESNPFTEDTLTKNITLSGQGSVEFTRTTEASSLDYVGTITGTGGDGTSDNGNHWAVQKTGPGKVVFTQAQTYTGGTRVDAGTLAIQGAIGTTTATINGVASTPVYSGNIFVESAANLEFNLSAPQVLSGGSASTITGSTGTITQNSSSANGILYVFNDGTPDAAVKPTLALVQGTLAGNAYFDKATFAAGTTLAPYKDNMADFYLGKLTFGAVGVGGNGRIGDNLTLDVNLVQASQSDLVSILSDLDLTGVSYLNVNATPKTTDGVNDVWRTGSYVILEAANITNYGGLQLDDLVTGTDLILDGTDVKLLFANATLPVEPRYHAELILHLDSAGKDQLILNTWIENRGIIWYGDNTTRTAGGVGETDLWGEGASSRAIWDGYGEESSHVNIAFFDGDHVLFLGNGAPQTVDVKAEGVTVFAMNIGAGANYTFTGGKITGDAASAKWKHDESTSRDARYTALGGGLYVETGGTGTFNAPLAFKNIDVWGTANFNARTLAAEGMTIYGPNGLAVVGPVGSGTGASLDKAVVGDALMDIAFDSTSGNGGILRFQDVGTPGYTHKGNISGPGNIEVRRTESNASVVTLAGANTHTGTTSVANGTELKVTGTFGTAVDTRYTHTGPIEIEGGTAKVRFLNAGAGVIQVIGDAAAANPGLNPTEYGALRGGPSTAGSGLIVGQSAVEAAELVEAVAAVASHVVLADHFNSYQGDLRVEGLGSTLEVTGHLGVWQEKFDHGTPFAATYYHAGYSGRIFVDAGASVDFATQSGGAGHADYQWIGGGVNGSDADGLTGKGTFIKSGPMPVYFAGRAGWFEGNTVISNGVFGMPTTRWGYDTNFGGSPTKNAGSFVVGSSNGATRAELQVPGGGSLYASSVQVFQGSTLSVLPGRYEIQVTPGTGTVTIDPGAAIVIRIGEAEHGYFRTLESDAVTDGGKLKVSGGVATGPLVIGDATGGSPKVNLTLAQLPSLVPEDLHKFFNLASGIDISIVNAAGLGDGKDLAVAIFGTSELKLGGAEFTVYFKGGSLLMELTSLSATIPEPSTYGLCGGVLVLLGAVAFRRKRKLGAAKAK